jgi:hypothetical protein
MHPLRAGLSADRSEYVVFDGTDLDPNAKAFADALDGAPAINPRLACSRCLFSGTAADIISRPHPRALAALAELLLGLIAAVQAIPFVSTRQSRHIRLSESLLIVWKCR